MTYSWPPAQDTKSRLTQALFHWAEVCRGPMFLLPAWFVLVPTTSSPKIKLTFLDSSSSFSHEIREVKQWLKCNLQSLLHFTSLLSPLLFWGWFYLPHLKGTFKYSFFPLFLVALFFFLIFLNWPCYRATQHCWSIPIHPYLAMENKCQTWCCTKAAGYCCI